MGLFKRLFGGDGSPPAGGAPPPNMGLRRDKNAKALDEATLAAGPFPRKVKLRPVYSDYALRGAWKVVTLESSQTWAAEREALLNAYYQRFGLISLSNGEKTIRWNEFTWRGIREALEFELDPDYTGEPSAGP